MASYARSDLYLVLNYGAGTTPMRIDKINMGIPAESVDMENSKLYDLAMAINSLQDKPLESIIKTVVNSINTL